MQVLVFGDVVGRIGREALRLVLPQWREAYAPAFVIANVENLAHGAGITTRTLQDLRDLSIDAFTGGNHLWDKTTYMEIFADKTLAQHIVRPLNDTGSKPGTGHGIFSVEGRAIHVLNVMGQAFFKESYGSPFDVLDAELANISESDLVFIDIHADTTSEKAVISRYVDGRASAVWGTHTHVPTADERLLPLGTAFQTDVGLTGAHNESIGILYTSALSVIKNHVRAPFTPPSDGSAEVNALLLTFNETSRFPTAIKRLREIVHVEKKEEA